MRALTTKCEIQISKFQHLSTTLHRDKGLRNQVLRLAIPDAADITDTRPFATPRGKRPKLDISYCFESIFAVLCSDLRRSSWHSLRALRSSWAVTPRNLVMRTWEVMMFMRLSHHTCPAVCLTMIGYENACQGLCFGWLSHEKANDKVDFLCISTVATSENTSLEV